MKEQVIILKIDLLGLMPCPLKIPVEQKLHMLLEELKEKNSDSADCFIVSNANQQLNFFDKVRTYTEIQQLPEIVIAPGFNGFFHRSFQERFKEKGYFTAVGEEGENLEFTGLKLQDPQRHYSMLCFNPTVLVVDKSVYKELPKPRRWSDLLKEEYEGKLAIRGHSDTDFCEGVLLNIFKENGADGVRRLGRSLKAGLHPSQMVKFAGSRKSDAPAVSAMPYSFARLVKSSQHVEVIWPEDGAIVNPVVMLVKSGCSKAMMKIAECLAGEEMGKLFADAYFPSVHPAVQNHLPEGAGLKWIGWDFIQQHDLGALLKELNEQFLNGAGRVNK